MSDPTDAFLGEIRWLGFSFNPYGWAFCNGATIPIVQQTALFALLGVNFGGNGTSTFQLPNLVGRHACGQGTGPGLSPRSIGEPFGDSTVTLTPDELASHNHFVTVQVGASNQTAGPNINGASALGASELTPTFGGQAPPNAMFAPMSVSVTGSGLPHENTQPLLAVNACISLNGEFPSFP